MTWMLRRAHEHDLDAIMAIENATFTTDAWSAGTMQGELRNPHTYYLVAVQVDDPTIIDGYAGLLAPSGATDADIQTIAVAASARRHGLGRTMMRQLITEARQRGASQVFLDVRADNTGAQTLYRALGFEPISVRAGYYQPDGVDAIVMRLQLTAPAPGLADRGVSSPEGGSSVSSPEGGSSLSRPGEPVEPPAREGGSSPEGGSSLSRPGEPVEPPAREGGSSPEGGSSLSRPGELVEPPQHRSKTPLVLGIETSCDETGVGIVRGTELLANVIASSMDEHARYGGVVPEIAARAHLEALTPTLNAALAEAGVTLHDLDAIAVTSGPGLSGALMVGIGAAKALAIALDKPLYAVNHLVGHVGADILQRADHATRPLEYPTIALLVSGGHTSLLHVRDLIADVELLGETIDDAAGEAFDKVARLLGLPYPGGPQIDRLAASGDPTAIRFPRGLSHPKDFEKHRYDFSFSGLKTAVARWVEQRRDAGEQFSLPDVAASFREAVVDVLLTKAIAACVDRGVPRLLLGGGVVANARVRELAQQRCAQHGIELRIPPLSLCTDNGAMIAALGAQLVAAGHPPSALGFGADSTLPVTTVQA